MSMKNVCKSIFLIYKMLFSRQHYLWLQWPLISILHLDCETQHLVRTQCFGFPEHRDTCMWAHLLQEPYKAYPHCYHRYWLQCAMRLLSQGDSHIRLMQIHSLCTWAVTASKPWLLSYILKWTGTAYGNLVSLHV